MLKAFLTLLLDPVALLLVGAAALGGYLVGWQLGSENATAACGAERLAKELRDMTTERDTLKGRLDTLNRIAISDAARATEAAKADRANEQAIHATPANPGSCLDAAAARRLRDIR
ncbi:MAG: hypothetical protein J0I31_13680 [Rhizobiales bacterium]|nr:hypothetical protein [Hyphomicrobiales bacterium]